MPGRPSNNGLYGAIAVIVVALSGMMVAGTALAGEDFAIPALLAFGIGGTVVLRGPLGKAIARRIEGQLDPGVDLEPLLHELDEVRARMIEMEERMDFTERLLARDREAERLPPG